jgi:hypothetical protein
MFAMLENGQKTVFMKANHILIIKNETKLWVFFKGVDLVGEHKEKCANNRAHGNDV